MTRKSMKTEYFGEFGYELISVIPFAYWLHKQNKLSCTTSAHDMNTFYYFSPRHISKPIKRGYHIPYKFPVNNIHVRYLNTLMWEPPPFKEIYKNSSIVFDKPICIICNKYNSEWGHPPITYFSKEMLSRLFECLSESYQVVYVRPLQDSIGTDNSSILDLNEHEWIKSNYPSILLIQDLIKQYPHWSFNELQLKLFANADYFISTQGGYAILCSYFKGKNIIYGALSKKRTAIEIKYKAFSRWYHKFSGATIYSGNTYDEIMELVQDHYI